LDCSEKVADFPGLWRTHRNTVAVTLVSGLSYLG